MQSTVITIIVSEGCIYFPGFEFAHLPAVALVSGLVLRCQRRCVYLLFIQPSRTGTAWRAPGPCSALDRQLRGDFSTHLGLGSLWGSSRVRLGGRKSEGSWCDVLAGGCYVKHVCAQTSSLSQTQIGPENIKSSFCAKE